MSKMFSWITKTWNPICGECPHHCRGCWAAELAKRYSMTKYQGEPRIDEKQINRKFKKGDFVFVQDMSDLFAETVPRYVILRVLFQIAKSPDAQFLLLTKNPKRYNGLPIPDNCVCGATIETDMEYDLTDAPMRTTRIRSMVALKHKHKMVSIEPIRKFTSNFFPSLSFIEPEFVAVGYDNYNNGFDEPRLEITEILIRQFEAYHIKVYRKTLREAHNVSCS